MKEFSLIEKEFDKVYVQALQFTMASEGLFANHPNDKGGMTYKGIARTYNYKWEGWEIIDNYLEDFPELKIPFRKKPTTLSRLNSLLNNDTDLDIKVYKYYFDRYFTKVGADKLGKLSNKVAIIMFDMCVLQGTRRAVKTLQRLLNRHYDKNLVVDGLFGANTYNAFADVYIKAGEDLTNHLLLEYVDNLNEASKVGNNIIFLAGWMNRVSNLRNYLRILK